MSERWPVVALGEVLTQVWREEGVDPAGTYRLLGARWYGEGLFTKDVKSGQAIRAKSLYRVKAGDFVYNRLFAWKGSFAVADEDAHSAYVSNEFPCFIANPERLDPLFLWWCFRQERTWRRALGLSSGATPTSRNRLKEALFLKMRIGLPSLQEQRRVVGRIDGLAAQIQEAKTVRHQASQEADALFSACVSQHFTEGTKRGWRPGSLGDYIVDCRYGTSEKTTDDSSGTPILRMGNIQSGRLDYGDLKFLHLSGGSRSKLLLEVGDILVNRTNSAELVGKCAVFEAEGEYSYASYLIRLRLNPALAEPRLVAAYINSSMGRAFMLSQKKQMTGQANINTVTLKALPISLPDIHEQRQIARNLHDLGTGVRELTLRQAEVDLQLRSLLPSILNRAFTGELQ